MEDSWLLAIDVFEDSLTSETTQIPKVKQSRNTKRASTCKFLIVGCPFKAVKGTRQLQKHMKTNFERHLSLMCKTVMDQNEQITEQLERTRNQESTISQLACSVGDLRCQLERLKTQRGIDEKVQKTVQQDIRDIREDMKENRQYFSNRVDELSEQITEFLLEHPIANITEDIQESRASGEHVWTLANFSRRLQRIQTGKSDDPIRSEPFYAGSPGYKLCVWVYLNGRGKSLGKAISVYGRVMAGEFDAIVKWPVRPQYCFTIFEQNNTRDERKDVVRTRRVHELKRGECTKGSGISRPQGDDRSIIVGFDDFVTHKELNSRGFLKDDVIFLKVEAEIYD